MRNTKQKKLIYEIVDNSHNHMTANEVYEKARESINNISLGTVYRILNVLSNNHQIRRITTKSGVDHFDSITNENHQHFICSCCGKITDVFNSKIFYQKEELTGFRIDSIEITFTGVCNECVKK